jgi:YjbE family integral membrane protein
MSRVLIDAARLFEIAGLNLLLSGDNAIAVGMAIRRLPPAQRKIATAAGIIGAVLLQIVATLTVASLLKLPAVSLAGGILLAFIAIRFLRENGNSREPAVQAHFDQGLPHAIMMVIGAYLVMSLDNILAIAAVGRGYSALLILGLLLSGGLLVPASLLIANLMRRYPVTLTIGAGILGWTAGSMLAVVLARVDQALYGQINRFFIPAVMTVVVVTSPLWRRPRDQGAQRH